MKTRHLLILGLAGLLGLSAQSCLKSYVEYFDQSSSERMASYLSDLHKMLSEETYGWRMEYFVGNEDGDFGGINLALKFGAEQDTVRAMSEEDSLAAYTSHYVLTTDSGPVLSFDTHNPILHKYGTASTDYYEGRGGDFQFFIIGYDKEKKVINLKGKRNGKFCNLYPLSEPMEQFNARMYANNRDFIVSSFEGFIDNQKVTGEIDVDNRQFTAYEMEEYGKDENGNPKYDIKETKTMPYILTEKGLHFYEPLDVFGKELTDIEYTFDMEKTDTLLRVPALNISLKGFIPEDWLPYSFYPGDYLFSYSDNSTISISLVPMGDHKRFRVKGISSQFDLIADYNIRRGRVGLRFQAVVEPDTEDAVVVDDRYIVVLVPWALDSGGSLWMNYELGMDAALRLSRDPDTGAVDMDKTLARPTFRWIDCGGARNFITDSFLLYLYDTDETADSPYAGAAEKFKFSGGNYQLPNLKSLTKI